MKNLFKIFFTLLTFSTTAVHSQCPDGDLPNAGGSVIVNQGDTMCMTAGNFTYGSLQINPGGIIRVCGRVFFSGSLNMPAGSNLILEQGALFVMDGTAAISCGANDGNHPAFGGPGGIWFGDPSSQHTSCSAQIYAIANPGLPSSIDFGGAAVNSLRSNRIRVSYEDGGFATVSGAESNREVTGDGILQGPDVNSTDFDEATYLASGVLGARDNTLLSMGCGGGGCSACAAVVAGTIGGGGTICSGATANLTSTAAASGGDGSTYTYQWETRYDNGGGFTAWGNATGTSDAATYSNAALAVGTHEFRRKVTSGACGDATTATVTVVVNATPTITGTTPDSRCGTGTVDLGATASAGTINWYAASSGGASLGTGTSYTTPSISSTTTYYVDATSGGCTTASRTAVTATVNPNPTADAGGALAAICQGAVSAAMGGSVGGGATGGTWSGGAGTWTNAGNPATATYTADASESGSITLTLTTSGGSCGTTTATKNITVNPNPTANAGGALAAICQGGTSAAMGGSVGGGATGGTWSGGAGTWTNAGNPATATYTADAAESGSITLTLTTSGGSCGTTTATKNITVNQNPTANAGGALAAICAGGTSAALGGSFGGGATGGTWTASSGTVNNPTDVANATYTGDGSTGSITLTLTTSGGSCGTTTATKNITVTATNTADAGSSSPSLCNNTALTNITHATTGATGISNNGVDAANGLPTGVSASWAGDVITISGTPSATGTFNYSIPLTGGCGSINATGTITVYGNVTAGTVATNQSISVGATASVLTESVATTGGSGAYTYQWQKSTNNGASWSNTGGTDNQATYSPGALSISTWFRRIDTDGCSSSATTNTVVIDVSMSVCSGSSPSAMDGDGAGGSGAAAGGGVGAITYMWESSTNSGASWSAADGTNNSADYSPSSVTQETWYRRKAIDGANGCEAYSNVLVAGINSGTPGAVPGPSVWLKADAGTGSIGTQWADQSGNSNHYTTSGSPTVASGDSSSNYNPYIVLAGGEGFSAPISLGANYTLFAAARKLSSDVNGSVIDGHNAGYAFAFSGSITENAVESITSTSLDANGIQPQINIGAGTGAGCDVHMYELIIYNRVLSSDSIKIVESYLETKWGVKGSDNFLSSAGTPTYDVSSYANDIVGIGKECYFHQKQSQTEDDSLIITLGTISDLAATNSANGQSVNNDVSYLMIGNDGARLVGTAATSADIPNPVDVGGITILSRIDREWKITNTNFSNNYTIEFEVIPGSLTANDIVLMVDDDGDFTSGASLYYNGDGSGINISIGSIVMGGLGVGIVPAGGVKFVALASKAPASALPVELIRFDVEKQGDYSLITWSTATEINNSHFIVQKSVDGIRWEDIEIVQGSGNSTEQMDYSAIDYEQCPERCYYKLKQVDFDGKYDYSMIKYLDAQDRNGANLAVYPIPVAESAKVEFTANSTAMYSLEVFSVLGNRTYEANLVCAKGKNVFDLNTSVYAPGMYYLVIRDGNGEMVDKVTFTK